jgi:uncharacterized protein (TIGR03089 family)
VPATERSLGDRLASFLARSTGDPLLTYYDQASEERIELSRATYANWVAKTSSYLVEECDLERGDGILIDLPPHWLGPIFLGACWTVGLRVVATAPDAVVTGPAGLPGWAASAGSLPVVACALRPLGGGFADSVPEGVRDFGREVWSQPDAFLPGDPPTAADLATAADTQADLVRRAASRGVLAEGGRLLSTRNPVTDGMDSLVEVVLRHGSLVLVANPDPALLPATFAAERATTWDQPMRS